MEVENARALQAMVYNPARSVFTLFFFSLSTFFLLIYSVPFQSVKSFILLFLSSYPFTLMGDGRDQ